MELEGHDRRSKAKSVCLLATAFATVSWKALEKNNVGCNPQKTDDASRYGVASVTAEPNKALALPRVKCRSAKDQADQAA